jgi:hypothetical protein
VVSKRFFPPAIRQIYDLRPKPDRPWAKIDRALLSYFLHIYRKTRHTHTSTYLTVRTYTRLRRACPFLPIPSSTSHSATAQSLRKPPGEPDVLPALCSACSQAPILDPRPPPSQPRKTLSDKIESLSSNIPTSRYHKAALLCDTGRAVILYIWLAELGL